MIFSRAFFAVFAIALLTAQPTAAREMTESTFAVLRTIDKLSARTHTFEIPVDKTVKFGKSLYIKVRACRESSPLDQPENAAFLQIWERKTLNDKPEWVFSGWMFSSNPSLSAMNHSVYDVWVIDCKNASTVAKSEKFSSEKAPTTPVEESAAAVEAATTEAPATAASPPKPSTEPATAVTPVTPVTVEEPAVEEVADEPIPDASELPPEDVTPTPDPEQKPAAPAPKLEELPSSFDDADE